MERTLYLWHNSEEKVVVDLYLIILVDQDGAHIVLVAKSPSEMVALHSVGFF